MLLVIQEILFLTNLATESTNIVSLVYQFIAALQKFVSEIGMLKKDQRWIVNCS